MSSGEFCCSSYRSHFPSLPNLLLCWRLSSWARLAEKSISNLSFFMETLVFYLLSPQPGFKLDLHQFPYGGGSTGFLPTVHMAIRRKPLLEGHCHSILMLPKQYLSVSGGGGISSQLCANSKLGKKEIRDLNSKIKIHVCRNKRRAKCFQIQTRNHMVSKIIIYQTATT